MPDQCAPLQQPPSPRRYGHKGKRVQVRHIENTYKGIFPEWYQSAYHAKRYILDRHSDYSDILAYIPSGMGSLQDVVVLQRP